MKLERLEVTGFGRLSDRVVEFSPSITLVVGPNEAGKTTLHRAIRAALYGIDAGGQGRPVERSDWHRWQPWTGRGYGLALTFAAADGRRYRVARRLDQREHPAQVQELGGGDVTAAYQQGRSVTPGLMHLGIDEAVFCATACLGEDGLRCDAPEAAMRQVDRLQEAVERLADSGGGVSAAQALARLREAAHRVGSERRASSALGATVLRLRQVDAEVEDARRRTSAVAGEEQRLRVLEEQARGAEHRRLDTERDWLVGRLAALAHQERALVAALADAQRLDLEMVDSAAAAAFPAHDEERLLRLATELAACTAAEEQAAERAGEARVRLRIVERRRAEIAAGRRLLAGTPLIDEKTVAAADRLRERLGEEAGVGRRADEVRGIEAGCAALRRELAATGLGAVPVGDSRAIAELLEVAAGGRPHRGERLAALLAPAGAAVAGLSLAAGQRRWAAVAAGIAALLCMALVLVGRLTGRQEHAARRELRTRCPGLELTDAALRRHLERIDAVGQMHVELQRQRVLAEAGRAELESSRDRIGGLAAECRRLAAEAGVAQASLAEHAPAEGLLGAARTALSAIQEAFAKGRRLDELGIEEGGLGTEVRELSAVIDEAERRAQQRTVLEAKLRRLLEAAGITAWSSPAQAVERFRAGCQQRRRHQAAVEALVEVRRRISALGNDGEALRRLQAKLTATLLDRGGDPGRVQDAEPLDAEALQHLEHEVERAARTATRLRAEADGLRARLSGLLDGLPDLADLEDERAGLGGARERALHQLAALQRAVTLIEEATRGVHRQVAPRLGAFVSERLSLLSDGRYREVNIDTDRFAVSLLSDDRPELVPLEVASHGTRDQVSLLLRMALCEVLGEGGETAPLLLDEPVLSADPVRRGAMIGFLTRLSVAHQVVVTTSDPAVAAEFAGAAGRHCLTVELDAPRRLKAARGMRATR